MTTTKPPSWLHAGLVSDQFVSVYVGSHAARFDVPRDLLWSVTPRFERQAEYLDIKRFRAIHEFYSQDIPRWTLVLRREDPKTFSNFIQWLYFGRRVLSKQQGESDTAYEQRCNRLNTFAYDNSV